MSERPYVSFDEVKRQVSILDALEVFGLADRFRKEGKTLAGVCPLPLHVHGPSPNPNQFKIAVQNEVSVFHCFGDCQRGGDVIEFVKLMTGLDHAHVRFWFAQHFGDRLNLRKGRGQPSETETEQPPEKEEAGEVLRKPQPAKAKCSKTKVPNDETEYKPIRFQLQVDPTHPYLSERGLTEESVAKYGLGLAKRGMLAGYIAIPVWNYPKGEFPFGYLGRWAGEDYDEEAGKPRYKWPPNFPKHRFLFGLNEALEDTDGQPMIVTEGVFGALHCVQNGFPCTVATFGSSVTDDQAELLIGTGRPIVLMFDGGEPGQHGMNNAVTKLSPHALVRTIRLEPKQQPDDLSRSELETRLSFV